MSSGLWDICKGVFTPKRALGFVEYGKKWFSRLSVKLGLMEGGRRGTGNQHQVDLKTLLVKSSAGEE